jgi:hypothetical protein
MENGRHCRQRGSVFILDGYAIADEYRMTGPRK